jgi:hypothetical protein
VAAEPSDLTVLAARAALTVEERAAKDSRAATLSTEVSGVEARRTSARAAIILRIAWSSPVVPAAPVSARGTCSPRVPAEREAAKPADLGEAVTQEILAGSAV